MASCRGALSRCSVHPLHDGSGFIGLSCGVAKSSQTSSGSTVSGRQCKTPPRWLCLLAAIVIAGTAVQVDASPDEAVRSEIEHLLEHLESSGCEFYRNGDWYDAPRARRHIERKYFWLVKRNMVASSEQFIERAATQSSLSGEPYLVRCGQNEPMPSADWLTNELTRLRDDAAASGPD